MTAERVAVAGLIRDDDIQIRDGLNKDQVKHFRQILDDLPPVLVVRAPEGDLLADGFHRAEAASKEGRAEIDADVRTGTREDAVVLAIEANARGHLPLRPKEREEAVLRLWRMRDSAKNRKHQRWTVAEVAKSTGTSSSHVNNIIEAEAARSKAAIHSTSVVDLPTKTWTEISHAPENTQADIVEAAIKGNGDKPWTADQVRKVVQAANNDTETYQAMIDGTVPVLTTASIQQDIKDEIRSDPVVVLDRFWVEMGRLRHYSVDDLSRAVTVQDRENFVRWAEEAAAFLTDLATSLKGSTLEAVQ